MSDARNQRVSAAVADSGCPNADSLAAFAAGMLPEQELATIADHLSHCETCESAVRGISGDDSLAGRLRAAVLQPSPLDEPACLRMQEAAKAIRPAVDESATAETELDAASGESRSMIERAVTATATYLPPLPAAIGRYRVISELGRGGFGSVYLAHDPDLDRQVAIKVPRFNSRVSQEQIDWFLHEARTAAKLNHPGIVAIYEVGRQSDGTCFIVMEYVEGRSLSAEMAKGRLPRKQIVQIVREAAAAVHYAHKKGLVHRDLKPGNILLDADGRVKIADFGLALAEDQQRSRAGELAGTLAYMSPEQVRREVHRLDGRSDIWALGVILYELLTGRRPFAGTKSELVDEIQNRSPKPPRQIDDTIPPELERVCLKCLAKDPEQRYTSAGDVARGLEPLPNTSGRSVLRWATATIAALACVASLYLSLTAMNQPEVPFRVDQVATPYVPLSVMERSPEAVFAKLDRTDQWNFNSNVPAIWMDNETTYLLGLGMTQSDRFKFRVEISKSVATGSSGIFVGLRQIEPLGETRRWQCQALVISQRGEEIQPDGTVSRPIFVERELSTFVVSPAGGFSVQRKNLGSVRFDEIELRGAFLEVSLLDSRICEIRAGGRSLPQLVDSRRIRSLQIPTCEGRFGILNYQGSATFRDARFELLSGDRTSR